MATQGIFKLYIYYLYNSSMVVKVVIIQLYINVTDGYHDVQ
jgi:hypothetical protein